MASKAKCSKHHVLLEDFGTGGFVEMVCPVCFAERSTPEAAHQRTRDRAVRRKIATARRQREGSDKR